MPKKLSYIGVFLVFFVIFFSFSVNSFARGHGSRSYHHSGHHSDYHHSTTRTYVHTTRYVTSYHHHHHHGYYYPFPYLVYEYYDGPHHDCHHHGHHYHDEGGYIHIGIGF